MAKLARHATGRPSNSAAKGRFDPRDFVYDDTRDEYRCPAEQIAICRFTSVEDGKTRLMLTRLGSSRPSRAMLPAEGQPLSACP